MFLVPFQTSQTENRILSLGSTAHEFFQRGFSLWVQKPVSSSREVLLEGEWNEEQIYGSHWSHHNIC